MIKIEELMDSWQKDSIVDEGNINGELIKIPQLHAKYLRHLNDHKLAAIKSKFDFDKMKHIKTEYYLGNLDKETLDNYGWEQFDVRVGAKGNLDRYLASDNDLIKLTQKKAYHEQVVYDCEGILNELKSRSWQLKSYIEYMKFLNGA
ncbi:MAG: recombination mediator protein UvsY [Nitrososphaerales archaeon]